MSCGIAARLGRPMIEEDTDIIDDLIDDWGHVTPYGEACLQMLKEGLKANSQKDIQWFRDRREEVIASNNLLKEKGEQFAQRTEEFARRTEEVAQRTKEFAQRTEEFAQRTKEFAQRTEIVDELIVETRTERMRIERTHEKIKFILQNRDPSITVDQIMSEGDYNRSRIVWAIKTNKTALFYEEWNRRNPRLSIQLLEKIKLIVNSITEQIQEIRGLDVETRALSHNRTLLPSKDGGARSDYFLLKGSLAGFGLGFGLGLAIVKAVHPSGITAVIASIGFSAMGALVGAVVENLEIL